MKSSRSIARHDGLRQRQLPGGGLIRDAIASLGDVFRDDAAAIFQNDGVRACGGHYDQDEELRPGLKMA